MSASSWTTEAKPTQASVQYLLVFFGCPSDRNRTCTPTPQREPASKTGAASITPRLDLLLHLTQKPEQLRERAVHGIECDAALPVLGCIHNHRICLTMTEKILIFCKFHDLAGCLIQLEIRLAHDSFSWFMVEEKQCS